MNRFFEVVTLTIANAVALFLCNGRHVGAGDQGLLSGKLMYLFVDIVLFLDIAVLIFYSILLVLKIRAFFQDNLF